jgi:bis(5'-nucleosyl)-tetraphosphatase (symmetrical)
MATYAIGDIQGCYQELCDLLTIINFDERKDQLWFAGDMVNRGPDSLAVLRFIKSLGGHHCAVLGNHDLHLLATACGSRPIHPKDTFQDILAAPDRDELCAWLICQPLLVSDDDLRFTMVHAGVASSWDLIMAKAHAKEVEAVLQSDKAEAFFQDMYGDDPDQWTDDLVGFDRLRCIVNIFTRMRYCSPQGKMILSFKGKIGTQPEGFFPWYEVKRLTRESRIVFGHWAALMGQTPRDHGVYALDTGCVWGGKLRAMRLEDKKMYEVASRQALQF